MVVQEAYMVDDVRVEFLKGRLGKDKLQKAELSKDDTVKIVEARDRQKLLILVGDTLADVFGVSNSHIMGLYNVVHLR